MAKFSEGELVDAIRVLEEQKTLCVGAAGSPDP